MRLVVDGIIYQAQARGGVSRIYSEILPRMCDLAPQLTVEVLTSGPLKQAIPVHQKINHTTFPHTEGLFPHRWFYRRRMYVRSLLQSKKRPGCRQDIWHSTYFTRPFRWQGPIVVTVLDMIYEHYPDLFARGVDQAFREQKRSCIEEADAIICISQSACDDLRQYYSLPPEHTHVIPLAASDLFRQLPRGTVDTRQPPFLLYVGPRHHYKNFRQLLQVYAKWQMRNEVNLVVVGRAWTSEEKQLLASLDRCQRVRLISSVSDERLCQLYNEAAALVYPSLYEGFGLPLLEAMKCGCPVVASRIPSTVEVAADSVLYFDPKDDDELESALMYACQLGRDSDLVRRGIKRSQEFSWGRCAEQTLAVYRQLALSG